MPNVPDFPGGDVVTHSCPECGEWSRRALSAEAQVAELRSALEALWDDIGLRGQRFTAVEVERQMRSALARTPEAALQRDRAQREVIEAVGALRTINNAMVAAEMRGDIDAYRRAAIEGSKGLESLFDRYDALTALEQGGTDDDR